MQITTMACPTTMSDPNIDPADSPVWVDARGNQYYIASGVLDGDYQNTYPVPAQHDRINIVLDMDALDALAAMGLTANKAAPVGI